MNRVVLGMLLLAVGIMAFGQTAASADSYGVIVYADGRDVTIQRGDSRTSYGAEYGEALGVVILPGDTVETDNETFVEIQMVAARSIIKIAENTVLRFVALPVEGVTDLSVTYGRVRARVDRLAGAQQFRIRGLTSVAGVRGTDFGYDQVLSSSGTDTRLSTRIYCFDGSVEVTAIAEADVTDGKSLTEGPSISIAGGEMVEIPALVRGSDDLRPVEVGERVIGFWNTHDFDQAIVPERELLDRFPSIDSVSNENDVIVSAETDTASGAKDASVNPDKSTPAGTPLATDESVTESTGTATDAVSTDEAAKIAVERVDPGLPGGNSETDSTGNPAGAESEGSVSRSFRAAGIGIAVAGLAIDGAAVGLYYLGDWISSFWSGYDPQILDTVTVVGGGMMATGIIAVIIGMVLSP